MPVETFYPDVTAQDGHVERNDYGTPTWASIITGAGTAFDSTSGGIWVKMYATSTLNSWRRVHRGIVMFQTSALPNNAKIVSAVISVEGYGKGDGLSANPDINVYSSNPFAETTLRSSDYNALGSIPFCDTPIAYADYNASGWNDFILNSAGIAAINKTGVSKFGFRFAYYDAQGHTPPWVSGANSIFSFYTKEQPIIPSHAPKLTVTYSTVYPTDAITRVTGITKIHDRSKRPTIYRNALQLGGLANLPNLEDAYQDIVKDPSARDRYFREPWLDPREKTLPKMEPRVDLPKPMPLKPGLPIPEPKPLPSPAPPTPRVPGGRRKPGIARGRGGTIIKRGRGFPSGGSGTALGGGF